MIQLSHREYTQGRESVIAVGNGGTGKTHMVQGLGLGLAACQKGMYVGFTPAAGLPREMNEARDERRLLNLRRQLSRLNSLIIDKPSFLLLSLSGSERLTCALLDRLTHHVRVLGMKWDSYRLRRRRENAATQASGTPADA